MPKAKAQIHPIPQNPYSAETVTCKQRLEVAKDFSLPRDEIVKVLCIFGQRGSGKTYAAGVFQEEEFMACGRFIIFDPVRAHAGILVLDGVEGISIEDPADALYWANEVTKPNNRTSYVFDLAPLGFDAAKKFINDFAKVALLKNRKPLKTYIEEAHLFLPLSTSRDVENIIRLATVGRQYGWGLTIISQRPAQINKNVLTQADAIIAMRLLYPLDVDTMAEIWSQAMPYDEVEPLVRKLPTQRAGQGIIYSPEWLVIKRKPLLPFSRNANEPEPVFIRQVQFRQKYTPHLASTPKFEPEKELSMIDINKAKEGGLPTVSTPEKADFKDSKETQYKNTFMDYAGMGVSLIGGYTWGEILPHITDYDNYLKGIAGAIISYLGKNSEIEPLTMLGFGVLSNAVINELKTEGYIK